MGLWDCGSTSTLLPASLFTSDQIARMDRTKCGPINGIGSSLEPVGTFECNVDFNGQVFNSIQINVVKTRAPPLIGMNILAHPSVQRVEFTRNPPEITFHRVNPDSTPFTGTIPVSIRNPEEFSNAGQIGPAPKPVRLFNAAAESELNQIRSELSVDFENFKGSETENSKVAKLIFDFREIFSAGENPSLGTFPRETEIPTTGEAKWIKQYPIPERYEKELDLHIKEMASNGTIEKCPDPKGFNTPVLIRPKKNGKTRFIMDFKNSLNKVLASSADPWQMPNAELVIARIGKGNRFFTTLDLKSGYHQVPIKESDRHKTAFQPRDTCWQWTRVPFGLTCAGQIFSRCIAEALESVQNRENFEIYIDDLVVYSKDFETHIVTLNQIFAALKNFNLQLNTTKCLFLQPEAHFLGRILNHDGYRADPDHVQGITDMNPPTTLKELQQTMGRIVWMRHFVETRVGERARLTNFSTLVKELTLLNRKENKKDFKFTAGAARAFESVKKRLSTAPVIHFADFTQPFVLVTDASEVGVGAVLMQKDGDKDCIVAVASSTLDPTQQNWAPTEREAYAVVWGIEKFDYFLRARPFTVLTDHKSLTYIDRTNIKNPKIARWQERLARYDFCVEYIEGHNNVFADMLSRPCGVQKTLPADESEPAGEFYEIDQSGLRIYIPSWCTRPDTGRLYLSRIPREKALHAHAFFGKVDLGFDANLGLNLAHLQRQDPFLRKVLEILERPTLETQNELLKLLRNENDHRGVFHQKFVSKVILDPVSKSLMVRIGSKFKFVAPESQIGTFLFQAHDNTNHFGRERCKQFLENVWWPKMKDDITNYLNSCEYCLRRKGINNRGGQRLTGTNLKGTKPFEVIYIDFVHMPKPSRFGHKYILTIIDSFSRFFIAVPTHRDRAADAAEGLVQTYCQYGFIPKVVSCDRGTHFTGSVMTEMHKLLGTKMNFHVAWHPESSGILERQHRTLKNALFITSNEQNRCWIDLLKFTTLAMNTAYNRATNCSPFACLYGRNPDFGLPNLSDKDLNSANPVSYGMKVRSLLLNVHRFVRISSYEADRKAVQKALEGKPPLKISPGDIVFIKRPQSAEAKSSKLDWIGPFKVLKTNEHVLQVENVNTGETDWVSRAHSIKLEKRKQHLLEPEEIFPIPFPDSRPNPIPAPYVAPTVPSTPTANTAPETAPVPAQITAKSGGQNVEIRQAPQIPEPVSLQPPPVAPTPIKIEPPRIPQKSRRPGRPKKLKTAPVKVKTEPLMHSITSTRITSRPNRLQVDGKAKKTYSGEKPRWK